MVMYLLCIYKKRIILIVKGKPKTNKLKKPFKNSDFFKPNSNEHFLDSTG